MGRGNWRRYHAKASHAPVDEQVVDTAPSWPPCFLPIDLARPRAVFSVLFILVSTGLSFSPSIPHEATNAPPKFALTKLERLHNAPVYVYLYTASTTTGNGLRIGGIVCRSELTGQVPVPSPDQVLYLDQFIIYYRSITL
jgi:hypothetical protein